MLRGWVSLRKSEKFFIFSHSIYTHVFNRGGPGVKSPIDTL